MASSLKQDRDKTPHQKAPEISVTEQLTEEVERLKAELERSQERAAVHQLMAQSTSEIVCIFDGNQRCLYANKAVTRVAGWMPEEMTGMHVTELVVPEHHSTVLANMLAGNTKPYRVLCLRKDESSFWAEAHPGQALLSGNNVRVVAIRDLGTQLPMEAELAAALHELEVIFENSMVGIMQLKGGRVLATCNQTLCDILGYDAPEEMKGLSMRALHLSEEHYQDYGKKYFASLAANEQMHIEYKLKKKNGEPVWCELSGKALDKSIPPDLKKGVIWVVSDITLRKEAEAKLKELATTDPLTRLLNRRHFKQLAERELRGEKRYRHGLSLLMVDIDHFKAINDNLGHDAGDEVLMEFTKRCTDELRENDLFGRLGGDEFVILLPHTGAEAALRCAERLRGAVAREPFRAVGKKLGVTISVGVAEVGQDCNKLGDLIQRADSAMYEAKDKGRDRVEIFDNSLNMSKAE